MAQVYIETYGCQMNEYDSELVQSILSDHQHQISKDIETADVILLNTCAVRENAHNKIYSRVGDLKYLRNTKKTRIGILGCMAQNLKDSLMAKNKSIDFVIGPDNYKELPGLIQNAMGLEEVTPIITNLSEVETYSDVDPTRSDGVNAWLAIMRGCNHFCSFCVVPYTRGRERSRTLESVVDEAKAAVNDGKKQVTLLGQNVNSYQNGEHGFTELMEAVAQVEGLDRVRFTSPHPLDFPEPLLEVIAKYPNLCNQIHLPLQAGNSEVLRRMCRGYTREHFLDIAGRIRKILPNAHISTDIIVGFPGETDEQYQETKEVMEEVAFESAFIFKYSPREGTLASKKYPDDVDEKVKTQRIVELNALQKQLTNRALEKFLGTEQQVLIENESTKLSDKQCQGKNDQGVTVVIEQDGSLKRGQMVKTIITDKTSHVLMGKALTPALT